LDAEYGEMAGKVAEILARLNSEQSDRARLEELERKLYDVNAALAGTEGRLDNLKIEVAGELKLVHEILGNLEDKLQSIDRNTSRGETARRTWLIALVAAIPGLLSIVLRLVEMMS